MTVDMCPLIKCLFDRVRASVPAAFSGLGLIFYHSPMRLPVVPLGHQSLFQPPLPIAGADAIAEALARISVIDSPWHDGFHLIDARSVEMTHVSQFFSPPLDVGRLPVSAVPVGARHMAAVLGSILPTVEVVALLTKRGESFVFKNGTLLPK